MLSLNQQFSGPTNFVRIRFTSRADTDPDHPHLLHHLLKKLLVLVSEDLEKKNRLKSSRWRRRLGSDRIDLIRGQVNPKKSDPVEMFGFFFCRDTNPQRS